jgi:hypothetical protein
LSYLPLFSAQLKRTEWITAPAKSIGVGATLFLFTMKIMAYLFLALTIINLPLMLLYVRGNGPMAALKSEKGGLLDVFAKLSIGNLGDSAFTCSNLNVGRLDKTLRWNCAYGTIQQVF